MKKRRGPIDLGPEVRAVVLAALNEAAEELVQAKTKLDLAKVRLAIAAIRKEAEERVQAIVTERLITFEAALVERGQIERSYPPEPPRTAGHEAAQ